MKKFIFLLIAASLTVNFLSAQRTNDDFLRTLYYEAVEDFNMSNYSGALKRIANIERILGGTNARLSYLAAQAHYKLGSLEGVDAAAKKYFASNPKKDPGYYEMLKISEIVSAQLQAEAQKQAADAAARRTAEQERAAASALNMQMAQERRAQDAESQKLRDIEESVSFKEAQQKNTREAYLNFIHEYPSGKLVTQARNEMQRKWPVPMRVLRNNKYGYMKDGKMVIKADYEFASEFSEGLARVGKNGKYGFINENGKVIIPIKYLSASNFNYGLAVLKTVDNKFLFVDKTGKPLTGNTFLDARSFSEGLAAVQDQYYKYGFINTKGELVIPCEYSTVSWFREGIAVVGKSEGGKTLYTYINRSGNQLTDDFEFEEAKDFQGGVARVRKNGKFGLIDKFGSPITAYEYDYISEFSGDEGLALARRNGFDIYLDREGHPFVRIDEKLVRVNL